MSGRKYDTREVFQEKVTLAGCEPLEDYVAFLAANSDNKDAAEKACITLPTDGKSVFIDGDFIEMLAHIVSNKDAIGVFGLAFYENDTGRLQVASMSGILPSAKCVAAGEYPVSRPFFFYIKKAHIGVIPGLKEYAEFLVTDKISGPAGLLAEYEHVADPDLSKIKTVVLDEAVLGGGFCTLRI